MTFLLPLLAYLTVGILLDFVYDVYQGDAVSRMANAFYVLHSRDPHLAAIGFVWNPLPSLVQLPILALNSLWPDLASHLLAASIASAIAMAGAVYQFRCCLSDWKVPTLPRIALTVLFALNPMTLLYGGNGMSEAIYLFTLLLTTRYLLRWMATGSVKSLVYAGAALGLAYLARNEAVGSATVSGCVVFAVSSARARGVPRHRLTTGLNDLAIFLLPFIVSFAAWAIASYVITGAFFAQLSSIYGTSSQRAVSGGVGGTYHSRLLNESIAVFGLAPALPILVIACALIALRRKNVAIFVPIAIIGGALGFDYLAYLTGSIAFYLRYFIAAVPLGLLLIGSIAARPSQLPTALSVAKPSSGLQSASGSGRHTPFAAAGITIMVLLLGLPTLAGAAKVMASTRTGGEELLQLSPIFDNPLTPSDVAGRDQSRQIHQLDEYLTDHHFRNGQILLDTAQECAPNIIVESADPRMFVITNDRDFQRILADPLTFHTHYMLVPKPGGEDNLDALVRVYPHLYQDGAEFATLIHQFAPSGCPTMRLYRVYGHPSPGQ